MRLLARLRSPMKSRHALFAFRVLPQYASMAGMLNQAEQNPSGLLADCIRMAAASHLERRCNVPLLQQGIKKEQYEAARKRCSCGCNVGCRVHAGVLLTAGIYRCCGIRKFRCAGTTIATLVHSGVDCVLVRGVC